MSPSEDGLFLLRSAVVSNRKDPREGALSCRKLHDDQALGAWFGPAYATQ
jgi:hypothetical protein